MHPELDLNQMVDFYSVFDGLDVAYFSGDVFEDIKTLILPNYRLLDEKFLMDKTECRALTLFAKNNRKRYSINREIQHFKALSTFNKLLKSGILRIEKSKENKIEKSKHHKLKRELRAYVIQDKILFKDHYTRFHFYFLKPNENLILAGKFEGLLEKIKEKFEFYQSFCFEQLAREFVEKHFGIYSVQSYWDRNLELDLYYKDETISLVGEVKFKNKKICKNVLNDLYKKAQELNLKPDYYIIFSKNGFSKELESLQDEHLLLFDLSHFKALM
ncbi:DUF234 domain-containing protein [Campylobacter vulpis]|nr:DUF234 domain-containing protein [Campylobacter vulpis]MBS4439829.1 DUF234 domain-containing protein [Campylobacter vulpis]